MVKGRTWTEDSRSAADVLQSSYTQMTATADIPQIFTCHHMLDTSLTWCSKSPGVLLLAQRTVSRTTFSLGVGGVLESAVKKSPSILISY